MRRKAFWLLPDKKRKTTDLTGQGNLAGFSFAICLWANSASSIDKIPDF
jgi:hypothetical protein